MKKMLKSKNFQYQKIIFLKISKLKKVLDRKNFQTKNLFFKVSIFKKVLDNII